MDKKTILALALIFIVFWLSNELIWKRRVPEEPPVVPATEETVRDDYSYPDVRQEDHRRPEDSLSEKQRDLPALYSELFDSAPVPVSENIRLENERIIIYFSNRGGVITEVLLKDYYHYDMVNLVNLIPSDAQLFDWTVETTDRVLRLDEMVFQWETSERDHKKTLTFYLENQGRRIIERNYSLNDEYGVVTELFVENVGEVRNYSLAFGSGIADTEETVRHKDNDYRFIGQIQNVRNSIPLRRIKDKETIRGNVDWAAIRSKYFILVLIPEQRLLTEDIIVYRSNESPAFEVSIRPGRTANQIYDRFELYLGPLDYNNLQRYGIGLEETIDMGWKVIRPLSRFFLWLLTNLNRVFGNYGITIIFFALILKIVLYPLTHKSFSSSHKMQKVQPYMQEIQRKYRSDPKQMQAELQKLYKEHGVNPLGGCFPLLLQMPIFFALYPVLRSSIEMRQASFLLWLTDLSEPDPYLILPILMGIFMFVQQKLMIPKTKPDLEKMDEKQRMQVQSQMQQQKMMLYIMPVFMVFIFRTLPAGLVLYWTVFNIFSIIQQYFIIKKFR